MAGFLLGRWRLARLGWDGSPGPAMRLRGKAQFSACAAGLLFDERGVMARGAYCGDAARRGVFRMAGVDVADVCFEDGTPFHRLSLATGVAQVRHDCGADRYEGRYRVLDQDRWTLGWRVAGPRKEQVIASLYTRTA